MKKAFIISGVAFSVAFVIGLCVALTHKDGEKLPDDIEIHTDTITPNAEDAYISASIKDTGETVNYNRYVLYKDNKINIKFRNTSDKPIGLHIKLDDLTTETITCEPMNLVDYMPITLDDNVKFPLKAYLVLTVNEKESLCPIVINIEEDIEFATQAPSVNHEFPTQDIVINQEDDSLTEDVEIPTQRPTTSDIEDDFDWGWTYDEDDEVTWSTNSDSSSSPIGQHDYYNPNSYMGADNVIKD